MAEYGFRGKIELVYSPYERAYELDFLNEAGKNMPPSNGRWYGLNKGLCKDVADIIKETMLQVRSIGGTLKRADIPITPATINVHLTLKIEFSKTAGAKLLKNLFRRHPGVQHLFAGMLYHYFIPETGKYKNYLNHAARSKALQIVMCAKIREPELYNSYCRAAAAGKYKLRSPQKAAGKKLRAARKPAGGRQWLGRKAGEESIIEGLGKAYRRTVQGLKKCGEFVIRHFR